MTQSQRVAAVSALVDKVLADFPAVPRPVVLGIINTESGFAPWATAADPRDLARGGSRGLMQMSYATAQALGYKGAPGSSSDLSGVYDPETNIRLGVKYLSDLLRQTGGVVDSAVSGYNAGLSSERQGDGKRTVNDRSAPFINQGYVNSVLSYASAHPGTVAGISLAIILVVGAIVFFAAGGRL